VDLQPTRGHFGVLGKRAKCPSVHDNLTTPCVFGLRLYIRVCGSSHIDFPCLVLMFCPFNTCRDVYYLRVDNFISWKRHNQKTICLFSAQEPRPLGPLSCTVMSFGNHVDVFDFVPRCEVQCFADPSRDCFFNYKLPRETRDQWIARCSLYRLQAEVNERSARLMRPRTRVI
jgi:hypothetical protein